MATKGGRGLGSALPNTDKRQSEDEEPPDMEMDVEDEVINTDGGHVLFKGQSSIIIRQDAESSEEDEEDAKRRE